MANEALDVDIFYREQSKRRWFELLSDFVISPFEVLTAHLKFQRARLKVLCVHLRQGAAFTGAA